LGLTSQARRHPNVPVNQFEVPRAPIDEAIRWEGFDVWEFRPRFGICKGRDHGYVEQNW